MKVLSLKDPGNSFFSLVLAYAAGRSKKLLPRSFKLEALENIKGLF